MNHDVIIPAVTFVWVLSNLFVIFSNERLSKNLKRNMESNKRVIEALNAALITEVDRLNGLLLDISNTIYTANANDHGACIVAMAKAREIATKGATE